MLKTCLRVDLGRRNVAEIWDLQRRLVEHRWAGGIPDVLLFVEHPPTYTLGRSGKAQNLLVDEGEMRRLGIRFLAVDRGGDITYHGPGQIVGYPIVDLREVEMDVHRYLRRLEEVLIRSLREFGILARREEGLTGVWHDEGKVAAIGVRVARWVTSHGFALNVSTDLSYFNHIVPCGIVDRPVTSMERILARPVSIDSVQEALSTQFGRVFERKIVVSTESGLVGGAHVTAG